MDTKTPFGSIDDEAIFEETAYHITPLAQLFDLTTRETRTLIRCTHRALIRILRRRDLHKPTEAT